MEQDFPPSPLSLYVHIPFCLSRCGYCSFFSLPYSKAALQEYLAWLNKEKYLYPELLSRSLKSIYVGGGTPSLIPAEQIIELLAGLKYTPEAEITLEVNPLQLTQAFLSALQQTPVNRLSIGLQSMDDEQLSWLGRRHKSAELPEKIKLCRDYGFQNLSLDFIYGLPGNIGSLTDQDNLKAILDLQPSHISCYLLSLEEDCALWSQSPSLPDDEELVKQYETICHILSQAAFEHYEISNFARPGYESRHNLGYWNGNDYLALGASGAGWIRPIRYQNPADLAQYYQNVQSAVRFPNAEKCSQQQEQNDWLMMGLRLTNGISLAEFKARFGVELESLYQKKLNKLMGIGMLCLNDSRLALTEQAYFVSTSVIGELLS